MVDDPDDADDFFALANALVCNLEPESRGVGAGEGTDLGVGPDSDSQNKDDETTLVDDLLQSARPHEIVVVHGDGLDSEAGSKLVPQSYGNPRVVCHLVNSLQRKLYQKFLGGLEVDFTAAAQLKYVPAKMAAVVIENFVQSGALRTVAAVADSSGHSKKGIGSSLCRTGCLALHGACWLIGAFMCAWRGAFQNQRYKPLAVLAR